ncbi:hypothetical protein [Microbacterium luticocti]|uniref:hypothetical protein n=1 Tax=Microbacterium luticocti TaxID=451764 RepID=UPI0003F756BB|nr:hypothetical protein [Microbacterium luticocti]
MDAGSLDAPVTAADVAAYNAARGEAGLTPVASPRRVALGLGVGFAVAAAVAGVVASALLPDWPLWLLIPLIVAVLALWCSLTYRRLAAADTAQIKLARLAAHNRWTFWPVLRAGQRYLPSAVLRAGKNATNTGVLIGRDDGVEFTLGGHTATIERAGSTHIVSFDFAELKLPAPVPHMILANRRAGVFAATDVSFDRRQRLSLEGDFDRTFALYCPREYERDALYVFTPDLMALFLDVAPDCEVELVDDRAYLFAASAPLDDRAVFEARFAALRMLADRLRRRTENYLDERSGASSTLSAPRRPASPRVAGRGRRLRTGLTVRDGIAIAVGAACAIGLIVYGLMHPEMLAHMHVRLHI